MRSGGGEVSAHREKERAAEMFTVMESVCIERVNICNQPGKNKVSITSATHRETQYNLRTSESLNKGSSSLAGETGVGRVDACQTASGSNFSSPPPLSAHSATRRRVRPVCRRPFELRRSYGALKRVSATSECCKRFGP